MIDEKLKGKLTMNNNIIFCSECRNDVTYTIFEKTIESTLKGENYVYMGKIAQCDDCGAEIYVGEVEDFNLKILYDTYRAKNGIISHKDILEIPSKYAIGKRPLSLLLGWGEQTFTRYCDGDMPTKQYSDTLKKIYNEPQFYSELLEKNKSNLKTVAAYEKSKLATHALLGINVKSLSKITLATKYILYQCEDITPLALQKALYYIQGFYYAFTNTNFFSEDCEAWVHGPVYREIYTLYSSYRFDPIEKPDAFNTSLLSGLEKEVLDSVVRNLCCYSGKVLESFTHAETPWRQTRGDLSSEAQSNRIIPKDTIGEYFIAVKKKYNMLTPNDIKTYSQTMFEQI